MEAVEALTGDGHSRQRYVQLREICIERRATDAWSAAVRSTERRKRRPDLPALQSAAAWFDSALVRELEKRGIHIPRKADGGELAEVRALLAEQFGTPPPP